jgi:putative ABC transport system permease protein
MSMTDTFRPRLLAQHLKLALRVLRKAPAFSALVIAILALGIGVNTAVFSVIDAVLLRQLPYGDPNRLVVLWEKNHALGSSIGERVPASHANYVEWIRQAKSFEDIAGFESVNLNRTGAGEPERIEGARVSPNFFQVFSVSPALGTSFASVGSDPVSAHIAVLSDSYWQTHFGGSRSVIGQPITLNDVVYTIAGVLPANFYLPATREGSDQRKPAIWIPDEVTTQPNLEELNRRKMLVFARLAHGATLEQARVEMDAIARNLQDQNPILNAGFGVNVFPIYLEDVGQQLRQNLLVLFSAVGLILLISCANLSNLVLSRATHRQRELGIRRALGASRADLIAQLLMEAVVLSGLGGLLALVVAYAGIKAIPALKPAGILRPESIHLGIPVLLFTMLMSFLAAALFGIIPAIRVSRIDPNSVIKQSGETGYRNSRRLISRLVVLEVSLATVLLIGAGFLMSSLRHVMSVDPGFHADHVLTMQFSLPPERYSSKETSATFCRAILDRVTRLPGVGFASFSDGLPMTRIRLMKFAVEGWPVPTRGSEPAADMRGITSPDYFATLGVPLISGRTFTADELQQNQPVIVVNQALVAKLWPQQDAIGKHILSVGPAKPGVPPVRYTVIGVQANARQFSLEDQPRPEITRPMSDFTNLTLSVRSGIDPDSLTAAIKQQIWAVDRGLPVYNVLRMQDILDDTVSQRRFSSFLLSIFGGLGILVACIGIYGALTFNVVQRTREIGIRMALGADRNRVLNMILSEGLLLVGIGISIGIIAGIVITTLLQSLLFGIQPSDPGMYAMASAAILFVAAVACYVPGYRATKIEPSITLRYE